MTPWLLFVIVESALTVTLLPMFPVMRLPLAMLESRPALLESRLSMTSVAPLRMMSWLLVTLAMAVPELETGFRRIKVP